MLRTVMFSAIAAPGFTLIREHRRGIRTSKQVLSGGTEGPVLYRVLLRVQAVRQRSAFFGA
jgi:hypothetical protein